MGLGIAGIQITVKKDDALFVTCGGYQRAEDRISFNPNENEWIFSITKTSTAALVMKLNEKGLIDLDETINNYLPAGISGKITGSDVISVRMLMNHTSGIVTLTELPEFIERQFTDPLHQPNLEQKLAMIFNKPLNFAPGSDFSYSNSNYLLLHLLLQNIVDDERIFAYRALRYARFDKTELPGFEQDDYALYSAANQRTLENIFEEYNLLYHIITYLGCKQ